jgi:hypothetical protein
MLEPNASRAPRRRLRRGVGALAMAAATVGVLASPAAADQRCTGASDANVCLDITPIGNRDYRVHVGIDIHMSRQDAQAIIDAPGNPVYAYIVGSDPAFDDYRFLMAPSALGSGPDGLGADFDSTVDGTEIDEDTSFFDDRDEIFAEIYLFDRRTGTSRTFRSDQFTGHF